MREILISLATIAALIALVPLIIWACSNSWREAKEGVIQYLQIMAGLIIFGMGTGFIAILADLIG